MGPALIEPDHGRGRTWAGTTRGCRNGAGSHRAGSRRHAPLRDHRTASPQWGRLSSSRITRLTAPHRGPLAHAAMGPALIEPDHAQAVGDQRPGEVAAMGPALIEPDHPPRLGA